MNNIDQIALEALKKPFREAQTSNKIKLLKHLFADNQYFKTEPLDIETIFPIREVERNVQKCFNELADIDKYDIFTADYLLRKYLSFVAYNDKSLYELCKQEAIFTTAKYILENNSKDTGGENAENLLMISGDFFGIQRFIFEATPADKAAKTLRSKSAHVQLLTRIAAFYIVEKLGLSYLNIISTNAGKFEILGINTDETKTAIGKIQEQLNDYFIENFFGETGIGISVTPCSFNDFEKDKYCDFRKRVNDKIEESKFKKFNLLKTDPVLRYDDGIDNDTLCPYCAKRKKKDGESCDICGQFIKIGEKLTQDGFLAIVKGGGISIFGGYGVAFEEDASEFKKFNTIAIYDMKNGDFRNYAKWEIASYVRKKENGTVMDFDKLAELSCNNEDNESGIKALIGLKGDVDGMGKFIKSSDATADFMSFNFFSRMVDYFFSVYASHLMQKKYQNLYTVFAGGDDLFLFGAWDQVIEFAKELREKFMQFTDSKLTFSVGMVLSKANKPVNFIASIAEEELEHAKAIDEEKDAIALFGECVKWDKYIKIRSELISSLQEFEAKIDLLNTAFLYHILDLVEMRKKLKDEDYNKLEVYKNTLWKSKLNYTFKRNIYNSISDEEKPSVEELLDKLYKVIENNPKETRMVLSEYIYKRRKQQ
jgi:CRISPR-associated protein Csm1